MKLAEILAQEMTEQNLYDSTGDLPAQQRWQVKRVTLWGMAANLGLAALKMVFGLVGHSQALVADAVHSLSDTATDLALLIGVHYWSAPADEDHPHGHGRIETLITCLVGILLASVGVGLLYRALSTMHEGPSTVPSWSAFAVACLSIVGKEWLYQWTVRVGRRIRSTAVIANAWHHRSDALSSVPVALAVLGSKIHPDWGLLDPIATVIVSVLILHASWKIAWPALRQLIDAGATEKECRQILALAKTTEGVQAVHKLRTRYIGPGLQVDLHVQVDPGLSVRLGHDIAGAVKQQLLEQGPDVVDVLVHLEPYEG